MNGLRQTSDLERLLADVLLARMLVPQRKPPAPKVVRDTLSQVAGRPIQGKEWDQLRESLREAGYLSCTPRRAYCLTDGGRQRALLFLGLEKLPRNCRWSTLQNKYLLAAIVRRYVLQNIAPAAPTTLPLPSLSLADFARAVQQLAAASPPTARFGTNKVFIAALWRLRQQQPPLSHLSLEEFKQHLVEANRLGLLTLSRADLVHVMDPTLVTDSETRYLNSCFHFVLIS